MLLGDDERLSADERAIATWARNVVKDPNGTRAEDVQALRDAGFNDAQVFAMTVFVALRLAFSSINGALGVQPAAGLRHSVPGQVVDAVTFGRPIAHSQ
ncbi:MAG TPA: hypothetical protein VG205_11380 [Acidimicrobiales bacterium]|nr:hypothetical protein [Acidimicrobiales bacterium]